MSSFKWVILDNTTKTIIGMYPLGFHNECQYRAAKYGHLMHHWVQCLPYEPGDKLGPVNATCNQQA